MIKLNGFLQVSVKLWTGVGAMPDGVVSRRSACEELKQWKEAPTTSDFVLCKILWFSYKLEEAMLPDHLSRTKREGSADPVFAFYFR